MSRIIYVNGEFVSEAEAKISVFDRGFLMADAVYEVSAVINGLLLDYAGHLKRLKRSLNELGINNPYSDEQWTTIHKELIQKNNLQEGIVYLQVTRGIMERDFIYPDDLIPSVVAFTQSKNLKIQPKGLKIKTVDDIRWQRRDIKTTQLLFQSWVKVGVYKEGFDDCWLVENGFVTEGSANNAWIIKGKEVITRPASHSILNGITRQSLIQICASLDLTLVERPFTVEEALSADEAFSTAASAFVYPVVSINNQPIGTGEIGVKTLALRQAYLDYAIKNGS